MSRGQLARTPDNFPRMKHRAAKRRARNHPLARLGRAFDECGRAFRRAFESIDWAALNRTLESWRAIAADLSRCDICQGTGDSNGADWCEECQGTGRILPPESDPADFDHEEVPEPKPKLTPPMVVEIAEQQRQDQARRRSADLAIERGHIRTSQQ
jgi:hypothetical protein